jgi:MFS family permease
MLQLPNNAWGRVGNRWRDRQTPTPLAAGTVTAGTRDTLHDNAAKRAGPRVITATVAGNALEFYDFVTYAYFAVYIGAAFFPAATPLGSLLLSVGVFGVGFVFRPLGSAVIGRYADRAGRRPAMLLTIVLITIGTAGLALTPAYATIGPTAPIIVVACRLVQGLALGGEVGPAGAFLIEAAPGHRRGFYSAWQPATQGVAALLAGIVGTMLSAQLSPEQLADWGWRVALLPGLLLIPVAFYLRRAMPETLPVQGQIKRSSGGLGDHTRLLALAVLVILGGTVSTYVGTYMTTYAITTLKLTAAAGFAATIAGGLAILVFALVGGWLSDRVGRWPVMVAPRVILAAGTWPMFSWLAASPSPITLVLATTLLTGLTALSAAASLVLIPELLPRQVRATGLAVAYAIGVSLFGGTTQFIITYLISATGDPTSPAWYVTVTSLISVFAMWALPESRGRSLEV